MLTLEGVRLRQGDFVLSADLAVPDGTLVAVIGPSGGGKSTLLAAIAGFLDPDAGQILLNGRSLAGVAPAARGISMLFQDNNLFPHLSVAANVGLGLTTRSRLTEMERARVGGVLDRVGLSGLGARRPAELSGGQQSRAALARVLLEDRPLVLLDEPFAALGPGLRSEMAALVRETLSGPGRVVLMVTHEPRDALGVADRVIFVEGGRAAAPVATRALLEDPPPALQAYLGGGTD